MKIVAATNNAHKLEELQRMLGPHGLEVISSDQAGFEGDIEETGTTFAQNARIKAETVYRATGCAVIADDSGLCVDALGGAPGVYSARYGGEGLDDMGRYRLLLAELEKLPDAPRTARYECAVHLILQSGEECTFYGTMPGKIGREPRGENGFGYDPVFYPEDKSLAQMTSEQKDSISHRGNAVKLLCKALAGLVGKE